MCIFLATTAHPSYAIIILDNRDEFLYRPTSRLHWWSIGHKDVLSSRDLLREEQGTWMGISKTGNVAVLTNFQEGRDSRQPLRGAKSRGEMVTAWLTSPNDESSKNFANRMINNGLRDVGGFSLVCGKLRRRKDFRNKQIEPFAIISNRATAPDQISWIAGQRGRAYGLSNTAYDNLRVWPKVVTGEKKLLEVVGEAILADLGKTELTAKFFALLSTRTFSNVAGMDFQETLEHIRQSICIPRFEVSPPMADPMVHVDISGVETETVPNLPTPTLSTTEGLIHQDNDYMAGAYGTQRQTVLLVDWDGNVTYTERALYNAKGEAIHQGQGDTVFEFKIDGWNCERGIQEHRASAVL